jgi:hypothetical protein
VLLIVALLVCAILFAGQWDCPRTHTPTSHTPFR